MATLVSIDGEVVCDEDAKISVFDRGFLYGDSVYEVMRTVGGNPVDLDPHMERLQRSAAALELSLPSQGALRAWLAEVLAQAQHGESYIRMQITRGGGEIGLDIDLADAPRTIIIVKPMALPTAELYERGGAAWIVGVQRTSKQAMDPSVKSGNYLNNILALRAARKLGATDDVGAVVEAFMCDREGRVAEGSTSNIFVVRAGQLCTPERAVGLLAGITRMRVIELATELGIGCQEGELTPDEIRASDEVFITSSVRGVLPITRVDGQPVSGGDVGPVTKRIMARYAVHLDSFRPR